MHTQIKKYDISPNGKYTENVVFNIQPSEVVYTESFTNSLDPDYVQDCFIDFLSTKGLHNIIKKYFPESIPSYTVFMDKSEDIRLEFLEVITTLFEHPEIVTEEFMDNAYKNVLPKMIKTETKITASDFNDI